MSSIKSKGCVSERVVSDQKGVLLDDTWRDVSHDRLMIIIKKYCHINIVC